jgi:hypothetical protein
MIKITLRSSKGTTVVLPINPEEITFSRRNNNKTVEIVGLGEIMIPGKTGLLQFTIDSFFWNVEDRGIMSAIDYSNTIHKIRSEQSPGNPLRFTAEGMPVNLYVLIENYDVTVKSGEELDRYYHLELVEYRPYGARKIEVKETPAPLPQTAQEMQEAQSAAANLTSNDLHVGQYLNFLGGHHYVNPTTAFAMNSTPQTAGRACIINISAGSRNPLHLIGIAGDNPSNVNGWVQMGTVIESVPIILPEVQTSKHPRIVSTTAYNEFTVVSANQNLSKVVQHIKGGLSMSDIIISINELTIINPTLEKFSMTEALPIGTKIKFPIGWS